MTFANLKAEHTTSLEKYIRLIKYRNVGNRFRKSSTLSEDVGLTQCGWNDANDILINRGLSGGVANATRHVPADAHINK